MPDNSAPMYRPEPADPTALTTQQIKVSQEALREILQARLDGMDKAIELTSRFPTVIDKAIESFSALVNEKFNTIIERFNTYDEKFSSINTQFRERDTRSEQTQKDSKVAVDAALQAAKEAVGEQNKSSALAIAKSEASTTKQIDQIGIIMSTSQKALDEKIDDLRQRLTSMDGQKRGSGELWGFIVGAIGVASTIITTVLLLTRHA